MPIRLGLVDHVGKGIALVATIFTLAGILTLTGCGSSDGLQRMAIFGKVEGATGRKGSLTLIPQEGLEAPAATVAIVDGSYAFDKTNGPLPGNYEAIIALDGAAPEPEPEPDEAVGPGDKVIQITKKRGRTFASFDVKIDEKRVNLMVPDKEPLELDIVLP